MIDRNKVPSKPKKKSLKVTSDYSASDVDSHHTATLIPVDQGEKGKC